MPIESKLTIQEAKDQLSRAIVGSMDEIASKLRLAREQLEAVLEHIPASELGAEVKSEIKRLAELTMHRQSIGIKGSKGKKPERLGNIKTAQKIEFLARTLDGKKQGVPLSELLDMAVVEFGCKRTATFLDGALADKKRFRKTKEGRSVSVVLVK